MDASEGAGGRVRERDGHVMTSQNTSIAAKRAAGWLTLAIILISCGLRVAASFDEFTLDEIWSLKFASELHSPIDVFRIHHDNNHWLNTLAMYWIGKTEYW